MSFAWLWVGIIGSALAAWALGAPSGQQVEVTGRLFELERQERELPEPQRAASPQRRLLAQAGTMAEPWLARFDLSRKLNRVLWLVGSHLKPGEFLAFCMLMGLAAAAGAGFLETVMGRALALPVRLLMPLAALLLGALFPAWRLKARLKKTQKLLGEQLPDALMLLINALRAGNSFLSGMQIVARQIAAPLSTQMAITLCDVNMGLGLDEALLGLQDRVGNVDVELLVSALLVQRETGGNMAEILANLHETMQDRLRIQGEIHALTAQGRLSGWVLSLLPTGVGFLFFLVNPGYILGLLTDPRGQLLVAGALVSQGIGIWVIGKIVNIRY